MRDSRLYGIGFAHIALRVSDFDRSLSFYTEGLGFRLSHMWDNNGNPAALIDFGNGFLELFGGAQKGEISSCAGSLPHFAFASEDVKKTFEIALSAGATPKREPVDLLLPCTPPLPITVAFVYGPDGETIEFFAFRGGMADE